MVSPRTLLMAAMTALALMAAPSLAAAPAGAASGAFEFPSRPVWAGEVFDLTLAWTVDWQAFQNLEGELDWKSDPLVAEPWVGPTMRGTPTGGRAVIQMQTRALALEAGRLTLQPAQQTMVIRTGTVDMEEYQRAITAPFEVRSAGANLTVRPLPAAPAGYMGAVGEFKVASVVDKADPKVGDSLVWTVTVTGSGNWPSIRRLPPRLASRDFEVIGEPKLTEGPDATLFERSLSETVTLIPQRAGTYVLSAFEMVVFDPRAGAYTTVRARPVELTVLPGPNGDLIPPEDAAEARPVEAADDALPQMLKGAGATIAPPPGLIWSVGLAAAPLGVAVLWLLLALQRALRLDPDRAARGAHGRMLTALDRLSKASDEQSRRRLVRGWQRDTTIRLKLDRAAPAPAHLADRPDWARLWAEADLYLYARAGILPQDWSVRAGQALAKLGTPPPFKAQSAFRPANLLPAACAAVIALTCLAPGSPVRAAEAAGVSETALRSGVGANPLDWRTRHNLAVALAAQDRWDEAAGHAAIAWVQNPASAETRRLWLQTSAKAGYSLDPGASVPRPRGWLARAAALASPATLRWIALTMAWLATGGLALILMARFRPINRKLLKTGLAVTALALIVGAIAGGALAGYGVLARKDAVLVWRAGPLRPLPVDTPADTAPVQLAAGATGRVEQTFLGWRRVRLGDGRSGWLRREHLLWVWTPPA